MLSTELVPVAVGVVLYCGFAQCSDVKNDLGAMICGCVKSISFGYDNVKTLMPSVIFKNPDSKPIILTIRLVRLSFWVKCVFGVLEKLLSRKNEKMFDKRCLTSWVVWPNLCLEHKQKQEKREAKWPLKYLSSWKVKLRGSFSFNGRELDTMQQVSSSSSVEVNNPPTGLVFSYSKSVHIHFLQSDSSMSTIQRLPALDASNPRHETAMESQKAHKALQTRRNTAYCNVPVKESRLNLVGLEKQKQVPAYFSKLEKRGTAISRWLRAKKRAAKVGNGLSKSNKAQKLTFRFWLEAIDERHRYGHNLRFYFDEWLLSHSRQSFFYWLDMGEGKEVNLVDKCPRSRLQSQCIKYLNSIERKPYEVIVEDGKFLYKQTRELLHTAKDAKWIFVLSTSKILYAGKKKKGHFQHSSFLAGGATIASGRLVVENGVLKAVWPHSGHYLPEEENVMEFIKFLRENNVDLTDVKMMQLEFK